MLKMEGTEMRLEDYDAAAGVIGRTRGVQHRQWQNSKRMWSRRSKMRISSSKTGEVDLVVVVVGVSPTIKCDSGL